MPAIQNYRDLVIWQNAMDFVPAVYETLKQFPKEENYALADQIRRAAISVPANIAEGNARVHRKEFVQFLSIARGSLAELDTLLELAHRLGYISATRQSELLQQIRNIAKPINALLRRLQEPND